MSNKKNNKRFTIQLEKIDDPDTVYKEFHKAISFSKEHSSEFREPELIEPEHQAPYSNEIFTPRFSGPISFNFLPEQENEGEVLTTEDTSPGPTEIKSVKVFHCNKKNEFQSKKEASEKSFMKLETKGIRKSNTCECILF